MKQNSKDRELCSMDNRAKFDEEFRTKKKENGRYGISYQKGLSNREMHGDKQALGAMR